MCEAIEYLPLETPNKQIRILQLDLSSEDDIIKGQMTAHYLDDVPSFTAISYTWGSPTELDTITVDGVECTVRRNCTDALWQARRHHQKRSNCYLWVDSICINQQDLVEKAHQVALMGDVYEKASEVYACIGRPDESSKVIFNVMKNADDFFRDFPGDAYEYLMRGEAMPSWSPTGGQAVLQETLQHWNKFVDRPYFSRLWIAQELHGGRERTTILCGTETATWNDLVLCEHALGQCRYYYLDPALSDLLPYESPHLNRLLTVLAATKDTYSLMNILVRDAACEDPRDQIYGILHLIDWHVLEVPRIVPDYSLSKTRVAMETIKQLKVSDLHEAYAIAGALEADVQSLIAESLLSKDGRYICEEGEARRAFQDDVTGICEVYEDDSGRLCVDLQRQEIQGGVLSNISQNMLPSDGFAQIFTGSRFSVLATQETRPGDLLVELISMGSVIVRPSNPPSECSFIGRAMLVNGFSHHTWNAWECPCKSADQHANYMTAQIRLSFQLSDTEALCVVVVALATYLEPAAVSEDVVLFVLGLDVPRVGTLVKDVSSDQWRDEQTIQPFHEACKLHGQAHEALESARDALAFGLLIQSPYFHINE